MNNISIVILIYVKFIKLCGHGRICHVYTAKYLLNHFKLPVIEKKSAFYLVKKVSCELKIC